MSCFDIVSKFHECIKIILRYTCCTIKYQVALVMEIRSWQILELSNHCCSFEVVMNQFTKHSMSHLPFHTTLLQHCVELANDNR